MTFSERSAIAVRVALLVALPLGAASASSAEPSRAELEARIIELERENAELKAQLGIAEQTLTDLRVERDRLGALAALPPKETPAARLTGSYDPQTERTFVDSKAIVIAETLRGLDVPHKLGVRFDFAGKEPQSPIQRAALVLSTQANTNSRYAGIDAVSFAADGEEISLPIADYRVTRKARTGPVGGGSVRIDEEILVVTDRDVFRRLALAQELRLGVGQRELELSRDHQALIVAVYERMRAAGTAAPLASE